MIDYSFGATFVLYPVLLKREMYPKTFFRTISTGVFRTHSPIVPLKLGLFLKFGQRGGHEKIAEIGG